MKNKKGEYDKLNCKEVSNEDVSLEEIKFKAIILKINEKKLISKQFFNILPDETEMEDVTHYTVEAQKIAIKWKKVRKESDSLI